MGRYRLGDIVRMTRKSLSITQEQLSDEICSVETLSRIENGSQNPSRDVYELLMERMGRIRDRAYSMLSVSDLKVLEQMKLFEDYIKQYDFHQAERMLKDIKKFVGNSVLDKQFLIRAESIVNYYLKYISAEEYLEESKKAIRLTIPKYGLISMENWPLSFSEAQIIVSISIAYAEKLQYHQAIVMLEEAYSAMRHSYMDEEQRAILQVMIVNNLSKWYGLIGKYVEAIEIAEEGIAICKKTKLGNALPNLLYGVAWNKEQLIEMGVLSQSNKNECLSYLRQAYFIASAMRLSLIKRLIKEHIIKNYNHSLIPADD